MATRLQRYPKIEECILKAIEKCAERFDEIKSRYENEHPNEAMLSSVVQYVRAYYSSDPFERPTKMTVWRYIQKLQKEGKIVIEKRPVQITIERCYIKLTRDT